MRCWVSSPERGREMEEKTHILRLLSSRHGSQSRLPRLPVAPPCRAARRNLVRAELATGHEGLHRLVVDGAEGAEFPDELVEERRRDRGGWKGDGRSGGEDDLL